MEGYLRPVLHRRLKVVDRRCKINLVAVHIRCEPCSLLRLEVALCLLIREGEPARGRNIRRFVDRIDLVFIRETLGNNFKLQLPDGAEHDVAEFAGEDLDGAFFAQFLKALLKLLGFEGVLASSGTEEFRRKVRDARELQLLTRSERIADMKLPVVVNADDVSGHGVRHDDAILRHEGKRIGDLHLASFTDMVGLHPGLIAPGTHAEECNSVAVTGIHIGLDLEDEARERRLIGFNHAHAGIPGLGRRRPVDECIEDIFDAIDDHPLGSASVAQVHKARLATGELVAVKVQRPHVQEIMAKDISIMRSLARRLGGFIGADQFLDLQSVVDELWQSFREETDFLVEARNLEEFRRNNAGCVYLECPKPYPALCTRHVVVMDYVDGIAIDDTAELTAQGYDCAEIGEKLMDNYASQMLDDGFFHADPHPGNLVVSGGKIVYMDLGIMGRLNAGDRRCVSDMLMAVARRDSAGLADGLLRFSVGDASEVDYAHLLSELDAIIANYGAADLSDLDIGGFVNSLVTMARRNGIERPGSVTMLARALVTLEGVVDNLLPEASMVDIIKRHLRAHESLAGLTEQEARKLMREGIAASHGLLEAVGESGHAMRMLTRGQLRLNLDVAGTEDPLEDIGSIINRLTLAIIAAGLFMGSSIVYYARIQPVIFGIPIIGFVGYLIALFIGLYVAHDILSEKHRRKR